MGNTSHIKIIGVTGSSGSGKSFVASYIAGDKMPIIDADHIAREVVTPSSPCLNELVLEFGHGILTKDGALKRKALGHIVFSAPEKLIRLNEITHKYIVAEMKNQLEIYIRQIASSKEYTRPGILIDAPLLIESNLTELCDVVITVLAERELRASRIAIRDNIPLPEAMLRINAQHDDNFYIEHADFILYNNGDRNEVFLQTEMVLKTIFND